MESKEEWRDIKDFEGLYQVSNTGKIRSLSYNNTGIITNKKLVKNKKGKMEINLWKNNKAHPRTVARLVFETFSPNGIKGNELIQYIDGNPENCSYENLYTISRSQMLERDFDNETRKRKLGKFDFYGEQISTRDITKMTGFNYNTIWTRIRAKWNIYEIVETPLAMTNRRKEAKEI